MLSVHLLAAIETKLAFLLCVREIQGPSGSELLVYSARNHVFNCVQYLCRTRCVMNGVRWGVDKHRVVVGLWLSGAHS
ncbi:hypothetical protein CFELI_00240 [Corynebacterium felinum]|uniref:Secreted protein n=1 Tax=Corynebacterium felinum TaxID=131318 RepID=A0ABU2B6U1_9CORY|nr:hypothetical protein [Corynebacterium felinum]WJY93707.1 hypothetical protein CFELI_00240 [Corynebacterium felinum]